MKNLCEGKRKGAIKKKPPDNVTKINRYKQKIFMKVNEKRGN